MQVYFDVEKKISFTVKLRDQESVLATFFSIRETEIYMKGFRDGINCNPLKPSTPEINEE